MSTTATPVATASTAAEPATEVATANPVSTSPPASTPRTLVSVNLDPETYAHFEKLAIIDDRSMPKFLARELKKLADKK